MRDEAVVFLVGLLALELRHQIPLLRRRHQAHVAVGGDALAVQDHLHGGVLLVHEDRVIGVLIQDHAEAARIQVAVVGHLHLSVGAGSRQRSKKGNNEEGLRPDEQRTKEHKNQPDSFQR